MKQMELKLSRVIDMAAEEVRGQVGEGGQH